MCARIEHARAFSEAAGDAGADVHLKVDTGMARLGASPPQLEALLDGLQALANLRIAGVMTHLSSADTDHAANVEQLERFAKEVRPLLS